MTNANHPATIAACRLIYRLSDYVGAGSLAIGTCRAWKHGNVALIAEYLETIEILLADMPGEWDRWTECRRARAAMVVASETAMAA